MSITCCISHANRVDNMQHVLAERRMCRKCSEVVPTVWHKHQHTVLLCIIRFVVSFCSIRSDHLMSQLKCPASRLGGVGVAPFPGRTVPVASSDWLESPTSRVPRVPRSSSSGRPNGGNDARGVRR